MKKLGTVLGALACALAGAALLFGFLKARPETAIGLFSGQFASRMAVRVPEQEREQESWDPFAEARKMQEEMEKEMQAGGGFGFVSGGTQQVITKEDEGSISYEISGVDATKLNVSVKDGYLNLSGETSRKTGGANFQSSFQRMFPLPRNVDSAKMETTSEKDKVILRFPKKKAG